MGEFNDPLRFLAQKLGEGISDARSKLIDEGWFGRTEPRDIPAQGMPEFGTADWVDWANDVTREGAETPTLDEFEKQWAVRERPPAETRVRARGAQVDVWWDTSRYEEFCKDLTEPEATKAAPDRGIDR